MYNHRRALMFIALAGALAFPGALRAQAPAGRFIAGSDPFLNGPDGVATVYDTKTKLTWQRDPTGPFPVGAGPTNPVGVCADLTLSTGAVGWRLPTLKELLTIVDYAGDHGPSALIDDQFFPNTPASGFVSATSSPAHPVQCVDFSNGWLGCYAANYQRCVR
jgi:hypothetical protein